MSRNKSLVVTFINFSLMTVVLFGLCNGWFGEFFSVSWSIVSMAFITATILPSHVQLSNDAIARMAINRWWYVTALIAVSLPVLLLNLANA